MLSPQLYLDLPPGGLHLLVRRGSSDDVQEAHVPYTGQKLPKALGEGGVGDPQVVVAWVGFTSLSDYNPDVQKSIGCTVGYPPEHPVA